MKVKCDHRSKFSNLSNFFQASSFQLLKLENILRWSHFTDTVTVKEFHPQSIRMFENNLTIIQRDPEVSKDILTFSNYIPYILGFLFPDCYSPNIKSSSALSPRKIRELRELPVLVCVVIGKSHQFENTHNSVKYDII